MSIGGVVIAETVNINGLEGALVDGSIITLKGNGFSSKVNPKPLFYWHADEGLAPSLKGRKESWDSNFNGELVGSDQSGVVIAEGSKKAVRLDFGTSEGAILGKVSFDADELYIWRKRYDDFDADYAYAIRTRLLSLTQLVSGQQLSAGVIMSTVDKTVVGQSISVSISGTSATIYYGRNFGNINDNLFVKNKVLNGDKVYFYAATDTDLTTPIYEAVINEGYGVFYTFNHKTLRFWGEYPTERNTTYVSLGDGVDSPLLLRSMIVNENTQTGTFWGKEWDIMLDHATKKWVREEYQYKVSDVDVENGELLYWQDGIKGWADKQFRFRTSAYPAKYSDVYMAQVSNGAQKGTYGYYDSLYIDDTWHRILVCESGRFEDCKSREIQIPLTWRDEELSFQLRVTPFKNNDYLYVYVVNSNGEVNPEGYPLCNKCPNSPPIFEIK